MGNGFMKGVTTGTILGMAAGMLILPQMDRSSRKRVKRTSKYVKNSAENLYDNMMHWMK